MDGWNTCSGLNLEQSLPSLAESHEYPGCFWICPEVPRLIYHAVTCMQVSVNFLTALANGYESSSKHFPNCGDRGSSNFLPGGWLTVWRWLTAWQQACTSLQLKLHAHDRPEVDFDGLWWIKCTSTTSPSHVYLNDGLVTLKKKNSISNRLIWIWLLNFLKWKNWLDVIDCSYHWEVLDLWTVDCWQPWGWCMMRSLIPTLTWRNWKIGVEGRRCWESYVNEAQVLMTLKALAERLLATTVSEDDKILADDSVDIPSPNLRVAGNPVPQKPEATPVGHYRSFGGQKIHLRHVCVTYPVQKTWKCHLEYMYYGWIRWYQMSQFSCYLLVMGFLLLVVRTKCSSFLELRPNT